MASLRKKYQGIVDQSTEPVTTPPVEAAKLPPVSDAPKPAEQPEPEASPVQEAAKSALKSRLEESERAAEHAKQQASQPQERFATELQQPQMDPVAQFEQMVSELPERMRDWYRVDPQFLEERAAQVQYAHHVVR